MIVGMDAETIESSPMFIIEHKQYGAFLGRFKLLIVAHRQVCSHTGTNPPECTFYSRNLREELVTSADLDGKK